MIDLHTHSTFSDGCLTPAALAELARQEGLQAVALTDHDTTDGVGFFLKACESVGVRGVAGVEVSAECATGTLHILGYFVRTDEGGLQEMLAKIRGGRAERNVVILEKLNRLGLVLTWDEVKAHAAEEVVGRPHFAQAMVARGYVRSREDAFERFLGKGQPAYADRYRFTAGHCIQAIRGAGGVPVLAHPGTLKCSRTELRRLLTEWCAAGLGGVEVYYSEHTPTQVRKYLSLARDFGLVATGGSDFHGPGVVPGLRLGRGFGALRVPKDVVDRLEAACVVG
jgi:predicted metal-dependent phosphoesterase TrpH